MSANSQRALAWCFTLNNYTTAEELALKQLECRYIVYGHEQGEEGTPHLQGYVCFNSKKSLKQLKAISNRAHWEVARGDSQSNFDYCTKQDEEPYERGVRPATRKERGKAGGAAQQERYKQAWELAKKGDLENIPEDILIRHYRTLKEIKKDHMVPPPTLDALENHWFWGASGTGKSSAARREYPDAYIKAANKWWDGYQGQEAVIIDDLDKAHSVLGHHLKIWGDHYPFLAETKGGAILIRPKHIIITSNYSIEEIFPFDVGMSEPIARRYTERKF